MATQGATCATGIGQADVKSVENQPKRREPCFAQTLEQCEGHGQYAEEVGAENAIAPTRKFRST